MKENLFLNLNQKINLLLLELLPNLLKLLNVKLLKG